ncbi:MAG: hypothetical protein QG657_5160 [Acidobacteriota bacterium]|nr:hypothetical protein [Acidobacteriota bacterium]
MGDFQQLSFYKITGVHFPINWLMIASKFGSPSDRFQTPLPPDPLMRFSPRA